jgi:hypothetical protein
MSLLDTVFTGAVTGIASICIFRPNWLAKRGEELTDLKRDVIKKSGLGLLACLAVLLGVPICLYLFSLVFSN